MKTNEKAQFEALTKHSQDCISKEEFLSKLKKSVKTRVPLIIKAGFDPTYPDLHLGHMVLLKKIKTVSRFWSSSYFFWLEILQHK